jgi:hypothetical protein
MDWAARARSASRADSGGVGSKAESEGGTGALEALSKGLGTKAEDPCRLCRLEALDAHEEQHLAVGGRERAQRRVEPGEGLGRRQASLGGLGRGAGRSAIEGAEALAVEEEEAAVVAMEVPRDRVEPGGEVGVGLEAGGVAGEADEGLLVQIVGEVPVAGETHEEAVDTGPVALVGGVEGPALAPPEPSDELRVVGVGVCV